ncbi:MAG: CoA-binding protein [Myxococcota bacterium]|jgi:predicted CoA-binding protein|nr:CoA-binding protein [Myxococcota bacterium]
MQASSDIQPQIDAFLAEAAFAVAGASTDRSKYGNKVLRCYQQHGRKVVPINPKEEAVEGLTAVADVASLPAEVSAISLVTPPKVTRAVVKAALERGIRQFWMQPGAEDDEAIALAQAAGANVLHSGPCLLVVLGYRD